MSEYKELVVNETYLNRRKGPKGIPFCSNKLNQYLNPIQQAQYYSIGGRPSGGKRSFVDFHFLFFAFINWYNQDPESRPPLKILYFNMNKTPKAKLQKLLCTYLWQYYQCLMDTNTLNGSSSAMYRLAPIMEDWIAASSSFFDLLLENVVQFYHGQLSPSTVYHEAVSYIKTIGDETITHNDIVFKYNPGHEEQITLVIVDDVRRLKSENGRSLQLNEYDVHKEMNTYMVQLRDQYKVTPVLIVPSFDVPGAIRLNQMTPDFREFKYYYENADVCLHLFNPDRFQIKEFMGVHCEEFVSLIDNVSRIRILSILRNTTGADNTFIPIIFLPENGYMLDLPEEGSLEEDNIKKFVQNLKITYKNGISS